ncbi:MAG: MerR family transcriptional regulator [Rhodospirillales bacterium]
MVTAAAPDGSPASEGGKSAAAFRTITEVATELETPQHVLRFWETKFPQIRPVKRRGGRRYYRPRDVALLKRIRALLYEEGYTIKGAQKLLREGVGREAARPAAAEGAVGGGCDPDPGFAAEARLRNELEQAVRELERLRALLAAGAG